MSEEILQKQFDRTVWQRNQLANALHLIIEPPMNRWRRTPACGRRNGKDRARGHRGIRSAESLAHEQQRPGEPFQSILNNLRDGMAALERSAQPRGNPCPHARSNTSRTSGLTFRCHRFPSAVSTAKPTTTGTTRRPSRTAWAARQEALADQRLGMGRGSQTEEQRLLEEYPVRTLKTINELAAALRCRAGRDEQRRLRCRKPALPQQIRHPGRHPRCHGPGIEQAWSEPLASDGTGH